MLHDLRADYFYRPKPSRFDALAPFARHAAVWLLVSLAVTALVWAAQAYGGLTLPDDPVGYVPWATPGAG